MSVTYQGFELVPSLQPQFQPKVTTASWWTTYSLPKLLPRKVGSCEPQDLGRGDTFRLSASLFDYTVMSTWNTTNATSVSQVPDQQRVEYRGESFANCTVNGVQFDFSMEESTQTVTVGVVCPGTHSYPIYVSMETAMVFAWQISKDFIGQYYGPGLNLMNIDNVDQNNYRRLAFAVLEAISTDSLTIMRGQHLSHPVLTISSYFNITWIDGIINAAATSNSLTYLNGTNTQWPAEADIYIPSIFNLVNVAAHTVNLDLGSAGPESIYKNRTALNYTIGANLAPQGISPTNWAEGTQSFYYGFITPPYQTWAQMLRVGQTITLGTVTGLPKNSSMVTTYLCPSYQFKPLSTFLTSILIATHSLAHAGWLVWLGILAFLASRTHKHCKDCACTRCNPEEPPCRCPTCEIKRLEAAEKGKQKGDNKLPDKPGDLLKVVQELHTDDTAADDTNAPDN